MSTPAKVHVLKLPESDSAYAGSCFETVELVERLHRSLLDVIRDALERLDIRDINSTQALMVFRFREQNLAAGDLRARGHYLGTNATHNLKKLVAQGYIDRQRNDCDKRALCLRLTPKGVAVRDALSAMVRRQQRTIGPSADLPDRALHDLNGMLNRLERFWVDQVRFRL